ncbi:hypothetical protein [Alteromonas sp. BMJM2]|uniref:hypothetical protein n=1 Tax=Alteromonas sp. BMJM2 TaxID=2954241 RepID=UPI0022B3539C|nr:hypothetical protein [Alteromonas sp. BMJM2]
MKTSLIAATLLSASMVSGVANAQESVLNSLLQNMVTTAVSMTASELSADVYQSVANTSYHFELDGTNTKSTGSVSVTDIASTKKESGVTDTFEKVSDENDAE